MHVDSLLRVRFMEVFVAWCPAFISLIQNEFLVKQTEYQDTFLFLSQSPASHHHKDVLTKYGSKPQATSGKHLKVCSRNGLSGSKTTLINSEVSVFDVSEVG